MEVTPNNPNQTETMTEPKYLTYAEQQQRLDAAAAEFPGTFGLRAFPGETFSVDRGSCYWSQTRGAMLYTTVDREGVWAAFCKGTPAELRREVTEVAQ